MLWHGYTDVYFGDSTQLTYLRSRFYAGNTGRFLTRDTWMGVMNQPMSFNHWVYVNGNPINYFDPTGHILENEAREANQIVNDLKRYSVNIKVDWGYSFYWRNEYLKPGDPEFQCNWTFGRWSLNELKIVKGAVLRLNNAMGYKLRNNIGVVYIAKLDENDIRACGRGCTNGNEITLRDKGLKPFGIPSSLTNYYVKRPSSSVNFDQWTVVHEIAHAWDHAHNSRLSKGLEEYTGGFTSLSKPYGFQQWCLSYDPYNELPGCNDAGYFYGGIPPVTSDINFNRAEDFAESVAAYVFPNEAKAEVLNQLKIYEQRFLGQPDLYSIYYSNLYYDNFRTTSRGRYIANLIKR